MKVFGNMALEFVNGLTISQTIKQNFFYTVYHIHIEI